MKFGVITTQTKTLSYWENSILEFFSTQSYTEEIHSLNICYHPQVKSQKTNILCGLLVKTQYMIEKKLHSLKTVPSANLNDSGSSATHSHQVYFNKLSQLEILQIDWVVGLNLDPLILEILQSNGSQILHFESNQELRANPNVPDYFAANICQVPGLSVSLSMSKNGQVFELIENTVYNRHWSALKNESQYLELSVHLIEKYQKLLYSNEKFIASQGSNHPKMSLKIGNHYPSTWGVLKYSASFYNRILRKPIRKIVQKIKPVRFNCWHLMIGQGQLLSHNISHSADSIKQRDMTRGKINLLSMPKNEFWADPFLFKFQGSLWAFFENYSYQSHRGKISCGKIIDNQIVDVQDVLNLPYHLSYPQIFEEQGEIFMIPETCENNRVEVYKCLSFPTKWVLYSTAFEGQPISDTTYHKDEQGQAWLFLNKGLGAQVNAELFIYQINSLKFESIIPHKQNPVLIDSTCGRNGGSLFRHEGTLMRPAQNNSYGIYGYGFGVYQINSLTVDEFKQTLVQEFHPNFYPGIFSTHHLHQIDDHFIIDVAFERMS